MCMCLKHNCTGPNHFSALASVISRGAHLIKPAMGSRQGIRLWQCPLTSCLSGPIHVNYEPLHTSPVE